jgi:cytidine deaminase
MSNETSQELIKRAEKVINPHKTADGRLHGDVGAALIGRNGRVYVGTCVDTASWGLCAERSAIAAMITDGEYKIDKIVAVWRDGTTQVLHVVPPCGICREFIRQIDPQNLDTEIVLGSDSSKKLRDLLPFHEWPGPVE